MFHDNKEMIQHECDRLNAVRGVMGGGVDHTTFFHRIRGDLLISGYIASDPGLLNDLLAEYLYRNDMPTILLSCHTEPFEHLRRLRSTDSDRSHILIFDPAEPIYHPFYEMDNQKLLSFLHRAAESLGYHTAIDHILQYASAALNIIATAYPVSLPALADLLLYDDDYIADYALAQGLNDMVSDVILANHEAGIHLRRICEKLQSAFSAVADPNADTHYSIQSAARQGTALQAFYTVSPEQSLMDEYLKEELLCALRQVNRVRVIADELEFSGSDDALLRFLFSMKRQGRIELIFLSRNAQESADGMPMNFSNVVLSGHDQPAATEALSKSLWGTYPHSYPVPVAGKPPALLFTLRRSTSWQISTQERLRVRAADLFSRQGFLGRTPDLLAVKTTANNSIFLVSSAQFLSSSSRTSALTRRPA